MGRRLRGAALRSKKRAEIAERERLEDLAESALDRHVTTKSDRQLFVLDTAPVKGITAEIPKCDKKFVKKSLADDPKVKALVANHAPEELEKLARRGRVKRQNDVKLRAKFDLWDKEEEEESPKKAKKEASLPNPGVGSTLAGIAPAQHVTVKPQKKALPFTTTNVVPVDVARPGQSYHPDPKQHQQVIETAVSIEMRREKALHDKRTPVGQGMSEETKALLLEDSSDDDESRQEEEEDNTAATTVPVIPKSTDKLTRAQRNKKRRLRAEQVELQQRKKARKLLNSVSEVPRIKKELKQQDQKRLERCKEIAQKKRASVRTLGKDVVETVSKENPIGAPTLPVALSASDSLRTVKPKGCLITERLASLADRKKIDKKKVGDKRKIVQGKRRKILYKM